MHVGDLLYALTHTSFSQTYDTAAAFVHTLGKTTCTSLDRPGFIVNRILMPMINEAFYTLMEVRCAYLNTGGLCKACKVFPSRTLSLL